MTSWSFPRRRRHRTQQSHKSHRSVYALSFNMTGEASTRVNGDRLYCRRVRNILYRNSPSPCQRGIHQTHTIRSPHDHVFSYIRKYACMCVCVCKIIYAYTYYIHIYTLYGRQKVMFRGRAVYHFRRNSLPFPITPPLREHTCIHVRASVHGWCV